ncbi:MAG TPA: hypothetical protein DCS43_02930 [Verrucomicrobia bacterium]|nr:hypothetical protein [Verrucomicrobiota bacterium]
MRYLSILLCFFQCCHATAIDPMRQGNLDGVNDWHATNMAEAATNTDIELLPRIRIDKSTRTVSFYAEATGLDARDPIEFFLIGEDSGNGYESIAVALARPEDIANAILKIGLIEGRSANPSAMQFWPMGERVVMTFNGRRAEQLLLDSRTGTMLPPSGLVFTGSTKVPSPDDTNRMVIAAQVKHPYSIAANYNEPGSILDVPWQAAQAAVYARQTQNPEFLFKPGERLLVEIRPEYTDGRKRVQTFTLQMSAPSAEASLADALFSLSSLDGNQTVLNPVPIDQLLAAFSRMVDDGIDPFVNLRIGADVPLQIVAHAAAILKRIDADKGIRMEPPTAGDLYYQAFTPNETLRNRHERFMQPWELDIGHDGTNTLKRIDETWKQGVMKPEITVTDIPVSTPEALKTILTTQTPDTRAIFVFAPPSLTYGRLMDLLTPVLSSHPQIHIYLK